VTLDDELRPVDVAMAWSLLRASFSGFGVVPCKCLALSGVNTETGDRYWRAEESCQWCDGTGEVNQ